VSFLCGIWEIERTVKKYLLKKTSGMHVGHGKGSTIRDIFLEEEGSATQKNQ
jgi:hypothetical protein